MREFNMCYKLIFDAMYGKGNYLEVAEKITQIIPITLLVADCYGRMLTNCGKDAGFLLKDTDYIGLEQIDKFEEKVIEGDVCSMYEEQNFCCLLNMIGEPEEVYGFHILIFKENKYVKEFIEIGKMLSVLGKTTIDFEQDDFWPGGIKEKIGGREIFDKKSFDDYLSRTVIGKKKIVWIYLPKEGRVEAVRKVEQISESQFYYFTQHLMKVLFYNIKNEEKILSELETVEGSLLYLSESFEDISAIYQKNKILQKMYEISKNNEIISGNMREKDWYIKAVYTSVIPDLTAAGLSDYSIQELKKADEKKKTELYQTLKTYLLCENNVRKTADKLFIHRNTLVYRLNQIQKFFSCDIDDIKYAKELLAFIILDGLREEK